LAGEEEAADYPVAVEVAVEAEVVAEAEEAVVAAGYPVDQEPEDGGEPRPAGRPTRKRTPAIA
jgi:hypothetical protein